MHLLDKKPIAKGYSAIVTVAVTMEQRRDHLLVRRTWKTYRRWYWVTILSVILQALCHVRCGVRKDSTAMGRLSCPISGSADIVGRRVRHDRLRASVRRQRRHKSARSAGIVAWRVVRMCQAAVADEKVPLAASDCERKMGHEHKAIELRNAYLRVNSCPQEHLKGLSRVSDVRQRQSRRASKCHLTCGCVRVEVDAHGA